MSEENSIVTGKGVFQYLKSKGFPNDTKERRNLKKILETDINEFITDNSVISDYEVLHNYVFALTSRYVGLKKHKKQDIDLGVVKYVSNLLLKISKSKNLLATNKSMTLKQIMEII